MVEPARQRFTFDEYLLLEERSSVKHEFLGGHVWAMSGGPPEHAAIAASVIALLGALLRDERCRVFSSDLLVRVEKTGLATYPDVTVVCGSLAYDPEDPKRHTITNPRLLCEVLSPSTRDYDRGEKLDHYKQIESLEEVMLVDPETRTVEIWTRSGQPGVFATLPVEDIFRDPLG
jgi:Uma2 family endonuclease